jgi:hypothetical protein
MYILKKIPVEDTFYNFENVLDFDNTRFIICGNPHFEDIGDEKLLSIVKGEYYDDDTEYDYEVLEELKKFTGKEWSEITIRGYCQRDWNTLYYVVDECTDKEIKEIEDFYMGKVTEFDIDDNGEVYRDFIPDDIVWEGKKSICDYLGLKEEETTIYEDDGYEKVYKYKEIV